MGLPENFVESLHPRLREANQASGRWTVEVQGQLTRVRAENFYHPEHKAAKRGVIQGFSKQSRLTMLRMTAKVDWFVCSPSVFITLTYPDDRLVTPYEERGKHRYLFHRAMEEYFGRHVPAIWRLEWKPRRSGRYKGYLCPHIHLMIPTVSFIPWRLVRQWWRQAIGARGVLKSWIRRIDGPDGAARYICKYVSKVPSLDYVSYHNNAVTVGRAWGVLRTRQIPRCPVRLYRVMSPAEIDFVKGLRRWTPPADQWWRDAGFTIFGKDVADQVAEILGSPLATGEVLV
jgi:hypothetical protein